MLASSSARVVPFEVLLVSPPVPLVSRFSVRESTPTPVMKESGRAGPAWLAESAVEARYPSIEHGQVRRSLAAAEVADTLKIAGQYHRSIAPLSVDGVYKCTYHGLCAVRVGSRQGEAEPQETWHSVRGRRRGAGR